MNLSQFLLTHFTFEQNLDFCIRLLVACIMGALIGMERSSRFKEAGVRTHVLVCVTGALIMLLSKYGFADLIATGDMEWFGTKGADPARVAAQAVSGISFLCAGVIFKTGNNAVKGLTTAAGIWMTACLGLTIGAGMYLVAICTLVLIFLIQFVIQRFNVASESHAEYSITFKVKNDQGFNEALAAQLNKWNAVNVEHDISWQNDGTSGYKLFLITKDDLTYEDIFDFVNERDDVISFDFCPVRNKSQTIVHY